MNRRIFNKSVAALSTAILFPGKTTNKVTEFVVANIDTVRDLNGYYIAGPFELTQQEYPVSWSHGDKILGKCKLKVENNQLIAYDYVGEAATGTPSYRAMVEIDDCCLAEIDIDILEISICDGPNVDTRIEKVSV